MSEGNNMNASGIAVHHLALVIDNHVAEILESDDFMFNVFKNHASVVDVTDKIQSGQHTAEGLIGGVYDIATATFKPAKPFPSWVWDYSISGWIPPVLMPTDGKDYIWSEETQSWLEISLNGTPVTEA